MASTYPHANREPELDLYTIPSYSSWFSWDEIHETERTALREFFDGTSISRTPKVYKEYRDFIINKYREDPTRRVTFTGIRKSLVGDVNLLRKVFGFLDKWGLINFGAAKGSVVGDDGVEKCKVRVEEGPCVAGVRVVAVPNSLKPISVWSKGKDAKGGNGGFKLPTLASYSDVFGELVKEKVKVLKGCTVCGGDCGSEFYECTKEDGFRICSRCFENKNYGENKSIDDFKFNNSSHTASEDGVAWSEAETLLLLESVLRHGDNWDLVAQNVKTKTKGECISKLLELPFAQVTVGPAQENNASNRSSMCSSRNDQFQPSFSECQRNIESDDKTREQENKDGESGDTLDEGPPLKRSRLSNFDDDGSSLLQQVACISTMVSPHITSAAAEAAVTALCSENSCSRDIFDGEDIPNARSSAQNHDPERILHVEDSEMKQMSSQSEITESFPMKDEIPLPLRIRAAVATALGAAAAHAKLLADQEEREIQHLVAAIIEAEMKKVNHKIKHFEDLECIMEKEYAEIGELKESLLAERIDVMQKGFHAGVSRWRDIKS